MAKRIVLIVLDGVGVEKLPDAAAYNDKDADSLGHVFDVLGDSYFLPNLGKLGLYKIVNTKNKLPEVDDIVGCYGKMVTKSLAKDSTAGHWEMAGVVLKEPFPTYPNGFPREIVDRF